MVTEIGNYAKSVLFLFSFIVWTCIKLLVCRKLFKRMRKVDVFTSPQKLAGKVAVVTGGSDGLGLAISAELVRRGAKVYILSRNQSKLASAVSQLNLVAENAELSADLSATRVFASQVDMSDFSSIVKFVNYFNQNETKLDILINNAGLISDKTQISQDGFDLVVATNYLGHFLLTELLVSDTHQTTVINVTSDMSSLFGKKIDVSNPGNVILGKIQSEFNCSNLFYMNYSYAVSKKMLEMYSQHFVTSLHYNANSSKMFCGNPGMLNTNFSSNWPVWMSKFLKPLLSRTVMKTAEDGVHVIMQCLFSPQEGDKCGIVYKGMTAYKDCNYYSDLDCELLYRNTVLLLEPWLGQKSSFESYKSM